MIERGSKLIVAAALCCVLVSCAAPEAIPDFRYYRLAPAAPMTALPKPLLDRSLVLENFRADGVQAERAILYANYPDSLKLSQYHYQLWNDPPPVMLQMRLRELLSAANVSSYVTDRLAPSVKAYRLSASIYRFEHVVVAGQASEGVLGLRMRLMADGVAIPLIERDELVRVPVSGARVEDGVIALSAAIDQIAQRLVAALQKRTPTG